MLHPVTCSWKAPPVNAALIHHADRWKIASSLRLAYSHADTHTHALPFTGRAPPAGRTDEANNQQTVSAAANGVDSLNSSLRQSISLWVAPLWKTDGPPSRSVPGEGWRVPSARVRFVEGD